VNPTNPFLKTELPLSVAAGWAAWELASVPGGPTWQQATLGLSIAALGIAYTLGRSWVKRGCEGTQDAWEDE
jgi:hypothetical protein